MNTSMPRPYNEGYKTLAETSTNKDDAESIIDVCISRMSSINEPGRCNMARVKALGMMSKLSEDAEKNVARKLIVLFSGTDDACLQENIAALLTSRLSPDIDAMLYNAVETGNGRIAPHVRHHVLSMLGIRDKCTGSRSRAT